MILFLGMLALFPQLTAVSPRFRSQGGPASSGTHSVWQSRGKVTDESVELFVTLMSFIVAELSPVR